MYYKIDLFFLTSVENGVIVKKTKCNAIFERVINGIFYNTARNIQIRVDKTRLKYLTAEPILVLLQE